MPPRRRVKDISLSGSFDQVAADRLLKQIHELEEELRSKQASLHRLKEEKQDLEEKAIGLRKANSRLEADKRHLEAEVEKSKNPMGR